MSADIVVGIDLGGTNMRAAVFRGLSAALEGAQSEELPEAVRPIVQSRERVGTERSMEAIVERLAVVIDRLLAEAGCSDLPVPVGIGFAGMMRGEAGVVAHSPHLGWRDAHFGRAMQEALGSDHTVVVENDVNAITWGEHQLGAARGKRNVIAVFVGTGIGGGLIIDGRLVRGAGGAAAEIGHTKIDLSDSARLCACGSRGCVEAYAGGNSLQRRARAELSAGLESAAVKLAGSAQLVNPGHLDAAAAEGDDYALNLWAEIAPLLGACLANAVTLLNPDILVLGGGVLSRTPVLREHVLSAFEVAVNPPATRNLIIADAALGDDAGLVGSALLALAPSR